MMLDKIQVEALFTPGCDSRNATLAFIKKVTTDYSLRFNLEISIIQSAREAKEIGFLGSSSIRVKGSDFALKSRILSH